MNFWLRYGLSPVNGQGAEVIVSDFRYLASVDIDIKPGSDPNSINFGEHGLLPVVILGSQDLDVTTIVPETIAIGVVNLASRGSKKAPKLAYSYETVDDGYTNMMVFFARPPYLPDKLLPTQNSTSLCRAIVFKI